MKTLTFADYMEQRQDDMVVECLADNVTMAELDALEAHLINLAQNDALNAEALNTLREETLVELFGMGTQKASGLPGAATYLGSLAGRAGLGLFKNLVARPVGSWLDKSAHAAGDLVRGGGRLGLKALRGLKNTGIQAGKKGWELGSDFVGGIKDIHQKSLADADRVEKFISKDQVKDRIYDIKVALSKLTQDPEKVAAAEDFLRGLIQPTATTPTATTTTATPAITPRNLTPTSARARQLQQGQNFVNSLPVPGRYLGGTVNTEEPDLTYAALGRYEHTKH